MFDVVYVKLNSISCESSRLNSELRGNAALQGRDLYDYVS